LTINKENPIMPLPPGPKGLPLIGDLNMLSEDSGQYLFDVYKRYGNLVTIRFGPNPLVFMRGPKYNRFIFAENAANLLNRPPLELLEGQMFGDGLLVSDGEEHKQARRMLQPAFHRQHIKTYRDAMVEETHRMIDGWAGEIDVAKMMQRLTLNIVARVLFDMDITAESEALSRAWDGVMNYNGHPWGSVLARVPFSSRRVGMRAIHGVINRMIAEHRANPDGRDDVIAMMLAAKDEDGTIFSDPQIRDHLMILFLAGHETSSNGLTWMLYLLAQYPQWTRKVLDELQTVLGGRDPDLADLEKLPVLDMIVKESMRILPPVVAFTRSAAAPFDMDGYHIPAGTMLLYTIIATHYLPEIYPDPLEFRPERFAPDAERKYSPYEYLPFGGGARLCLGQPLAMMEIKIALAIILQKFRLDLVPEQTVKAIFRGSLYPKNGLRVTVNPQDGEGSPARVYGNVPGAVGRQLGSATIG
jgi:cytochrome P450